MPFFKIVLNDDLELVLGEDDLDILSFGILSTQGSPTAYLQITSTNKEGGVHKTLLHRELECGDHLMVEFQRTLPSAMHDLKRTASKGAAEANLPRTLGRRVGFAVRLNMMGAISARVDDDSMLHVEASWTRANRQCLLGVACIRMTAQGQNQLLLEQEILEGQPFSVQVI